jgi:hypothetical protein
VHLVGSYYTDLSRWAVNKTLNRIMLADRRGKYPAISKPEQNTVRIKPSRRRLKVVTMRNLTFENFLFQQNYHRGDWLSRVKGKKGVVEASFLACLVFEGHGTRLLIFYDRVSRGGWPAKGVVCSTWRTVRRRLGRRMSMSVSKIQFGLVFWKLWFRSYFPDILGAHLGRGSCCVQLAHGRVSSCFLGLVIYIYVYVIGMLFYVTLLIYSLMYKSGRVTCWARICNYIGNVTIFLVVLVFGRMSPVM